MAYYGGKTTLAPKIAALLPEHGHYVEPFAGSLAVLLAKEPTTWETVNDLDDLLVTFWRVLRDRPEELARACLLTPHSRGEYAHACRDLDDADELERARCAWVRIIQSRKHSLSPGNASRWRYSVDVSHGPSWPDVLTRYVNRMESVAQRLRNVSIENRDAIDLIERYGSDPSVCLYVDPPYLADTRVTLNQYRLEAHSDDFHDRLNAALSECVASVVLSGYASDDYEEALAGWHRVEMKAPHALSGGARTEVLWSNRPMREPDLFDLGGIA